MRTPSALEPDCDARCAAPVAMGYRCEARRWHTEEPRRRHDTSGIKDFVRLSALAEYSGAPANLQIYSYFQGLSLLKSASLTCGP